MIEKSETIQTCVLQNQFNNNERNKIIVLEPFNSWVLKLMFFAHERVLKLSGPAEFF
jgi:hypothetical protein